MSLYEGIHDVADVPAIPTPTSEAEPTPAPTAAQQKEWSASLGFQPVIRRKPAKAQAKPLGIISAPAVVYAPEPTNLQTESEDVNGFRKTEAGQKSYNKSKKNKRKKQTVDPTRDFNNEYDPAKPNDYAEYKVFRRLQRLELKAARRTEQRRKEIEAAAALAGKNPEDMEDDEEDEEDDSEEDRPDPNRYKGRFFAPPASYESSAPSEPASAPQPINLHETADEIYARRAAMAAASTSAGPSVPPGIPAPPPDMPAMPLAPPAPSNAAPPGHVSIAEAQAKARAIAERLSKMGANAAPAPAPIPVPPPAVPTPPSPPSNIPQKRPNEQPAEGSGRSKPQPFAERLMAKYGWQKGQGLGATNDGIVNAISVSMDPKQRKGNDKKTPIGMANTAGRGTIVSETKEAREKAERARFGEPTKVVCLTNVVSPGEVDDELPLEIAEEGKKYGLVDRCFTHIMPFNTPDHEAVRVFIVFSGEVGAWQAVKAFDGRFFGGRTVRARFFDPTWIERGVLGMQFQTEH